MPVEHVNLSDPQLHDVKGASTATSKQILVANGAGASEWQKSSLSDHAVMNITNNATATTVTAAADATLSTDSDYVKVTAGWAASHLSGITFNVDELVVNADGDYKIDFWCTLKVPSTNNFVGLKYAINDTIPYSLQKIKSQSVTTNDYRNLFASGIVTLTSGQTVSMYVAASKTDNLVFEEAGIQVTLIHEN